MQRAPEHTFYSDKDVTITSARAILYGTTYALSNVASVRAFTVKKSLLPLVLGIPAMLFGLPMMGASVELGLAVVAAGIISILAYALRSHRHFVRLGSASGETSAMESTDPAYVQTIVAALNEAIVSRG